MHDLFAVAGSSLDRGQTAPVSYRLTSVAHQLTTLTVRSVVSEIAEHAWAVQLGGQKVDALRWVGTATVDVGLFSAPHLIQHIDDVAALLERT